MLVGFNAFLLRRAAIVSPLRRASAGPADAYTKALPTYSAGPSVIVAQLGTWRYLSVKPNTASATTGPRKPLFVVGNVCSASVHARLSCRHGGHTDMGPARPRRKRRDLTAYRPGNSPLRPTGTHNLYRSTAPRRATQHRDVLMHPLANRA